MKKSDLKKAENAAVLAVLIVVATLFPIIAREYATPVLNKLLNFVRTFFYIGLFSAWGVSVNKRVVQKQVRRYLLFVSALMVFWLFVRELRFRMVIDETALRFLWYCYYIPIVLIPMISVFVSLSLNRGESYRLPRAVKLLSLPCVALVLCVLTNELHQLVFRFPEDGFGADDDYSYGVLFYILTATVALMAAASFVIMLTKSSSLKNKKIMILPVVPYLIATLYFVLYALRSPVVWKYVGDVAVAWCLFFTGYFESCIQSGLIQSNTRYPDLFAASGGLSIQITDNDYNVHYKSANADKISADDMRRARGEELILPDGKRLRTIDVNGGHAVWTEDVSGLINLHETLEFRSEELEERAAFLQLEYNRAREHKIVEEQNRLYDLLQSETQSQLDAINLLVEEYKSESDSEKKRGILARISVLGSYIKRRKNFVLSSKITADMLERAFAESARSLRLLGIKCTYLTDFEGGVSGSQLTAAYDFFEDVTETVLDEAHFINVRVCFVGNELRANVMTDCTVDSAELCRRYERLSVQSDADGTMFILPLGKGGDCR